jgi:hypothetical protein
MDFIDQIKQFSKRVESLKDSILTEEATKTSIIMPFFSMLGYDVFNPEEFVPEFTADVGIKKGEKVDYAIFSDGAPTILIEAKWIGENLDNHDSQLFRYFGTTAAKFAILTNGIVYRFFTDLEEPNKMDTRPFLEINILDIKENLVEELKKFQKCNFDVQEIFDTASELKYSHEIKKIFAEDLKTPSEEIIRYYLGQVYSGLKTQNVIERFRPIIKKALNQFVTELMNEKIKTVLDSGEDADQPEEQETYTEEPSPRIITTTEELEAYFIIKNLLRDLVPMDDIGYKDTASYIAINYRNNARKRICRLMIKENQRILIIPDENKKDIKIPISNIYELENHKDALVEVLKRYL